MSMKVVGTNYYVHKSNVSELLKKFNTNNIIICLHDAYSKLDNLEIIKYDKKVNCVSFIQSPDWFTAYEPVVGDSIKYDLNSCTELGITKGRKNNKQIYHSKELFMDDNYDTTWMNAAKERTALWNSIPGIKEVKSKIGNQNFWFELLDKHNIIHD